MASKRRPGSSAATGTSWLRFSALLLLGLGGFFSPRAAEAQVLTKVGSFVPPTTGPNPQNYSVTGVGFQPKAVIFFWTAQTAAGFGNGALAGYGFATAAGSERAVNFLSDNNVAAASANSKRWQWNNRCVVVTNSSALGTVNADGSLVSMDADGFTLSWARGSAWIIHYMALGGPDITNAAVGSFTPTAGTGSQAVTGLAFPPDFLMFLSVDSNTVGTILSPHGQVSVGYAGRSKAYGITQGGSTAVSRAAAAPIMTTGAQLSTAAILEKDVGATSRTFVASVTSFDATGFTVDKTINTAGTETVVHYLALRGGQYRVNAFTRPAAAGPQSVPYTGVGFAPKGLLFQSWNLAEQIYDEDARMSFSAADAGSPFQQRATFFHDKMDNPSDNDNSWVRQGTSGSAGVNGKVVYLAQAGDCPPKFAEGGAGLQCVAGPRVTSEADVASYDADGFTLNWTTNDTANTNQIPGDETNAQVLYVAFGDPAPPSGLRTKVGSFFSRQFVGNGSVTGIGFQPKAVIFYWTTQETPGFAVNAQAGYGFATGVGNERAANYLSDDNLAPGSNNTSRWQWTNRCIVLTNTSTAGTTSHEAQLVSMDADGFTLSWLKATVGVNYIVHYLALGGPDITKAATGSFTPTAGTGSQAVTGLSFQPDFLMFLSIDSNTAGSRVSPHGKISIGFASNGPSINQVATTVATRSSTANPLTSGAQAHDAAVVEKAETTGSITFVASVTSFDANGFTVNKTVNAAGSETPVQYLALRGGQYKAGTIARPSTATPPTFPLSYTGVGFAPKGLLFMSWGNREVLADPAGDAEARICFGAADSTPTAFNQRATFFHDKLDFPADGDNMLVRQNTSGTVGLNGRAVYLAQASSCPPNPLYTDPVGPAQCSGLTRSVAEADVASYDADGFTLNWMVNDITNTNAWAGDEQTAQISYVAFGNESTTEVALSSFTARGEEGGVSLEWETASELHNLGFHLYRATAEQGPYERITSSLIPGLGSSPIGARYSYADKGLANGVTYYYKLEDVETSGRSEQHGPVFATPRAAAATPGGSEACAECTPGSGGSSRVAYGDPRAGSLRVVRRSAGVVELDLVTGGFYATPAPDGSVRIEIPGFEVVDEPGAPAIPVRRALLEALAGRKVRISAVVPHDVVGYSSLRPAAAEAPELVVGRDGTVRAGRRRARMARNARGLHPQQAARVVSTAFQGEVKKALVELAPLRFDPASGRLLLARRLRVRLVFSGREPAEIALGGSLGRLYRPRGRKSEDAEVVARLAARASGLYAVGFEQIFPARGRPVLASELRLSRLGKDVAVHLEPDPSRFSRGSVLYFLSEGAALSAYANEAVYELSLGAAGTPMPVAPAPPAGAPLAYAVARQSWELNRYYMSGLVEAPDIWLWDSLLSGTPRRGYPFSLSGLAATSEPATLRVWMQGASDLVTSTDHHVRVYLNGSFVTEASWDGKTARQLEAAVSPGILQEGQNRLELDNVADTGAAYSMVYLDRFSLDYPHTLAAEAGRFESSFGFPGSATVTGLGADSVVVDTTDTGSRWITGTPASGSGLSLSAEAGHRYLALSPQGLLRPEIRRPAPSDLRSTQNQADYLLLGPRDLLPAATPLIERRQQQGLQARSVALEEVFDLFGYGERSAEAIRDFLAYAYHRWSSPSPRYVLLLGDATLDPKDYASTGVKDHVPAFMFKSSYLWTVSDPAYAAVNGDDFLPDLALGRLPASSLEQAQGLVQKLLSFEDGGFDLSGPAVLVADNPDKAGNFEQDADEIASGVLASHTTEKIYLRQLGTQQTRSAILDAFDRGASLLSYVGHGGTAIWASENLLNSWDVGKLSPQPQQPVLFTMNCLNGYFLPPAFDSLAEALVKAEGKGAIAAFSPSGLSLDAPAHLYHQALLQELLSGRHARLGDAILAAQSDYAATGAFPELLRLYNLFGDPALSLR